MPSPAIVTGFPPAPLQEIPPASLGVAASRIWVGRIVDVVNNILRGKMNVVLPVTLAADADSTTITDSRISPRSILLFSPLTADAAAEIGAGTLYVSSQSDRSAIIAHANNSEDDRSFNVAILA